MPGTFTVRVRTAETDEPIRGAQVGVVVESRGSEAELRTALTDASGEASFELPDEAVDLCCVVRARGRREWTDMESPLVPRRIQVPRGASRTLDVRMDRGTTVAGRVVDDGGKPVDGATVIVQVFGDGFGMDHPLSFAVGSIYWPPPCTTDADGRFDLLTFSEDLINIRPGGRPGGRWVMSVEHPDHAPGVVEHLERVPVDAGVISVSVRLTSGGAIRGRVAATDGRGIAGARIRATDAPDRGAMDAIFSKDVRSSDDGSFEVRGLRQRAQYVEITCDGYAPERRTVNVVDRASVDLDVDLAAGTVLEGVLFDAHGNPDIGTLIQAVLPTAGSGAGIRLRTETGHDGRFRFEGLPSFGEVTVSTRFVERNVTLPSGPVELRIPSGVTLEVVCIDPGTGDPLDSLKGAELAMRGPAGATRLVMESSRETIQTVPGAHEIGVYAAGRAAGVASVDVGESGATVEIPLPPGGRLAGRVSGPDRAPLAGVEVRSHRRREGIVQTLPSAFAARRTDPDGRYELTGLDASTTVTFAHDDYAVHTVKLDGIDVSGEVRMADVTLMHGATVQGRVTRPDGSPVAHALVCARPTGAGSNPRLAPTLTTATDADGRYVLARIPPGPTTLHLGLSTVDVDLTDGETRTVDATAG